nr:hypothetical protein [Tanacetum cinerariifolium]
MYLITTLTLSIQALYYGYFANGSSKRQSHKEMRALRNAESALKYLTPMEFHKQYKMQIGEWEMRSRINSYWEELSAQIEHGKTKTSDIISKLCHIEQLLTELPTSKRA